ncbi:MAG: HDOD domain-containing protein [Deltaproteobacteria bacterium]|nr:HDOD domain-containing protein [Deltaproteobacteria bacterium]
MKKRILFVDDEPNVLQGLGRMLRNMRHEWDMQFADSGAQALALMERKPAEVVVTDMRMPGMDGGELLHRIKDLYPQAVRIVLSGHSEKEMVMKAVQSAHQYLAKPCDADTLKITVTRAYALREILTRDALRRLVSRIGSLPSLPSLYTELLEELRSPRSSTDAAGRIISRDLGMTSKVLQLVNSAFFGLPRHIETAAQAARLLGLETVKALVLGIEVFSKFSNDCAPGFDLQGLWSHSLAVGAAAKLLARQEKLDKEEIDQAFVGGLLHDVGKLVLASHCPEEYADILETSESEDASDLSKAEHRCLGAGHAEVGAYLLGLWGLPDPVMEAAAFHHAPSFHPSRTFGPVTAVHAANALVNVTGEGREEWPVPGLDMGFLEETNVVDRLPAWQKACKSLVQGEKADG